MKDGIYRVTLTIDGQPVVAEARVRNGVLQGLGELAGLVGVMSPGMPSVDSSPAAGREAHGSEDLPWTRRDLDGLTETSAVDAVRGGAVRSDDLRQGPGAFDAIRSDVLPRQ